MKYLLTLLGVAALFVVIFTFRSCEENIKFSKTFDTLDFSDQEKGNGEVVEEVRPVANFTEISVRNAIKLVLKQGDEQHIVVRTDSNLQDKIKTEVKNGVLKIYARGGRSYTEQEVVVTLKDLQKLRVSGAADAIGKGLKFEDFTLSSSGAAEVRLTDFRAKSLYVGASGAANIRVEGNCDELEVKASGSADTKLYKLSANTVKVEASGAADVEVTALSSIDARASGAADVNYSGNPTVINKKETGAADISKH